MYDSIEKSCSFIINTLYHQTIFCIILFILIFGLAFILKEKSPRWQIGLWFLILIRLILPTDFSLSYSARNLLDDFLIKNSINTSLENVSEKPGVIKQPDQNSVLNISGPIEAINSNGAPASWKPDIENNISLSWPVILSIFWILGCLVFLYMFLRKICSIKRILNRSSLVREKEITAFVEYWRQSFRITRPVAVFSSDEYMSPFTVGLFRPKIFIPEQILDDMDRETVNSIIAHEMVHIKRFDHMWIRLQNVLQIIYFFNPVVWYANSQLNIARERLCDSEVLARQVIPPETFGKSVIDVLKFNLTGYRLIDPLLCFSNHKKVFEYRIKDILKEKSISKQKTLFTFLIVCLLGLFLLPMSSAKIDANILESPDESLSYIPEKSRVAIEPVRFVAVVNDDVIPPVELDKRTDEITGQKAEENNIRDKNNNFETRDKDRDVLARKRSNQMKTEVKPAQAMIQKIKKHKDPFVLASKEKNVNFAGNTNSKLYESGPEQRIEPPETAQQGKDSPVDYKSRGRFYQEKGQTDDAVSDLNKAIELNPEDAAAYFYRGNAYFAQEEYQGALDDFSKAIELDPGYIEAYINRGKIYHDVKNMYRRAIADYSKAIELNPEDAVNYYLRGNVYFGYEFNNHSGYPRQARPYKKSDERRALSDFNMAIKLNPRYDDAYVRKGYIYFNRGNYLKAIKNNEMALDLNPDNALAKRLWLIYSDAEWRWTSTYPGKIIQWRR